MTLRVDRPARALRTPTDEDIAALSRALMEMDAAARGAGGQGRYPLGVVGGHPRRCGPLIFRAKLHGCAPCFRRSCGKSGRICMPSVGYLRISTFRAMTTKTRSPPPSRRIRVKAISERYLVRGERSVEPEAGLLDISEGIRAGRAVIEADGHAPEKRSCDAEAPFASQDQRGRSQGA